MSWFSLWQDFVRYENRWGFAVEVLPTDLGSPAKELLLGRRTSGFLTYKLVGLSGNLHSPVNVKYRGNKKYKQSVVPKPLMFQAENILSFVISGLKLVWKP